MQQYAIIVKGKVQGVWFRKHTLEKALQLQLRGYVINKNDGSVYIEAVGPVKQLDTFILWLKNEGAPLAIVTEVIVSSQKIIHHYNNFSIRK